MCIHKVSGKNDNDCGHVSSRHCYMSYYVLFMPAIVGQPVIQGGLFVLAFLLRNKLVDQS